MTIGISVYNTSVRDLLQLSIVADEAGFDAVWLGEHVVAPLTYTTSHPMTGTTGYQHISGPLVKPETELVDPWAALGAVAGATRRLRVATGITVLPFRHPLLTARSAFTLQEASEGRLVLGVGAGWLPEEFAALGVPFDERYSRFRETIEILRTAWAGTPFDHRGKHFTIDSVQLSTRAVHIPIILGGNAPGALRRAAALGDGWFSAAAPTLEDACRLRDELLRLREENGRHEPFPCYFRIAANDPDLVDRYRREGIDDVIIWDDHVWPTSGTFESKRAAMLASADDLGLR